MFGLLEKYLNNNNYNSLTGVVKDNWMSHPNYPSLLAATDSLTSSSIENFAIKIPFKHFKELPNVFITELEKDSKEFYFLEKNDLVVKITNEKGSSSFLKHEDLSNIWTGVVLIIEENEQTKTLQTSNSLKLAALLFTLGLFIIYTNNYNVLSSIFLILSLFGVFISIEILKTYLQDNNLSESSFCSASKEFSCSETIKSQKYVFSQYVEFVDLPIIFFGFTSVGLVLSVVSINTIGILSSLSLPIIVYSIYVQKMVLNKWCFLCLLISFILIINTCLFWFFQLGFKTFTISEIVLIPTIATLWFYVKKLLLAEQKNKISINELLRFKRNEDVFNTISFDVLNAEELNSLPKVSIGNTNAPNTLSLFLSPSCPHCHTAFEEAISILEKHNEKLRLEIAYNLNVNNTENPYLDIAKVIMQLNNQNASCLEALEDWHIKKLSLEDWKTKWKKNDDFDLEKEQLEKQFQWCVANNFNYAPVKLFNRKLLPQVYEIEELFYFFKEEN